MVVVFLTVTLIKTMNKERTANQSQQGQAGKMNPLTLKDYPKLFSENVIIVVGENATEVENESAVVIKENLKELTGNEPIIKNDTELLELDKRTHNLILVGTPNTNYRLQEVYKLTDATRVTNEYPGENKGILEILKNPWSSDRVLLIVAGSDKWGVKGSSETLAEDEKIEQFGGEVMMTKFTREGETNRNEGTASEILNTTMNYIKRNHPDAATFIQEDMFWTRSKVDIRPGYSRYVYTSNGWIVTIGYAITPQRVCEAKAEYNQRIVWTGTIKDGAISERSYVQK